MDEVPEDLAGFCRREWPRLVGGLELYTGDREVARDMAQEAMIRLCQRWATVRSMAAPRSWLHAVAFNLARSHYRRRAAEERANRRSAPASTVHRDADVADRLAVRTAVAALPPRQRAALVARYYLGHSTASTAALLGVSEPTVKSNVHRAVHTLRRVLGPGVLVEEVARDAV